jgi:geranylgeranyl diphosphate synthase type II
MVLCAGKVKLFYLEMRDIMDFKEELDAKVVKINNIINDYLPQEDTMAATVEKAMNYSILAGGKRIRPLIMWETYKMFGGQDVLIEPFMAALEMIHTYSLVHDDLPAMDNDKTRRGKPTTHVKFGEDIGILAGDALLNYAYETMLFSLAFCEPSGKALNGVRAASYIAHESGVYGMVGGQTVDVEMTGKPLNEEQLDFIFQLKTGALIDAAFASGGILAGVDEETIFELSVIGKLVGIAFQIQDDILDVIGSVDELGKPVLSDEKNKKTTYVTMYGLDKAQADVEKYSHMAIEKLKGLGDNQFLCDLVEYLIHRKN